MAFATDLSVSGDALTAVTTNQKTFSILSYPGPGKSTRIDTASTAAEPLTLEISHRREGSGANVRSVRTVIARRRKLNATTGATVEGSVGVTFRIPDDTTLAAADYKALINYLMNGILATSANADKLLRGEV